MADGTDENGGGEAAMLEYASPAGVREGWGPMLFRPSGRSGVLVVLLMLAAVWFGLRHDPWRRVGTLPGDMAVGPPFTRDGLILTFDSRAGVNVYDPATGRRVRNVLPAVDPNEYRYFVLNGGERILAIPYAGRVALVYDVRSGQVVERLPNPDGLGSQLVDVAPDAARIITARTGRATGAGAGERVGELTYWDLTRAPLTGRAVPLPPLVSNPRFSPDGRRVLDTGLLTRDLTLLDGRTMGVVASDLHAGEVAMAAEFIDADRFWVLWIARPSAAARSTTRPMSDRYELYSASAGRRLAVMPVPAGLLPIYTGSFTVCDDGRTWALLAPAAPPAAGWLGLTLHVADAVTGRVLLSRGGCTADWPLVAFPGSRRLLAGDMVTRRLAVFSPPHAQPVAVLPDAGPVSAQGVMYVSPDGRTILTRTNPGPPTLPVATSVLTVYRPAGWDCPESRFGALAFPQTWLTGGLVALVAVSLVADARRARREAVRRPASPWLIGGLLVVAAPLTAHALLAAMLGHPVRTPAPVLLVVAVLLGTHARFWRGVAVVALCGLIPLLAWWGYGLRKMGLSAAISYQPLDRFYDVRVRLPLAAVGLLAALVFGGLYLLLRPRRVVV